MSENNVENTSTSGENLENKRLRSWLEEKLDSGQFPCLSWVDKDRGMFQIHWQHDNLDQLCKKWAEECGPDNDAKVNPPPTKRPRLRSFETDQPDEGKNNSTGLRQAVTASRDILETAKNTRSDCCTYKFAHQPGGPEENLRAGTVAEAPPVPTAPSRLRPERHGGFDVAVCGAGPSPTGTMATVSAAPPPRGNNDPA
ncbi:hypothetical protein BaRGS_00033214, partial [Batillaria attramentaria]